MSHDDADPDDTGLEGLRSMWRSLPDEEPSARGLDSLMAAARVKAEEMAPPSLWQRFVAMMRQPQVLALATIMILIGGAVFISQRRDTLEAAQTTSAGNEDQPLERAHDQAPAAAQPSPAAIPTIPAEEPESPTGGASAGSAVTVGGAAKADKGDFKSAPAPGTLAPPKISKKVAHGGGSKTPMKPKAEQQTKSGMASGSTTTALSIDELGDSGKATEEAKPADDAQAPTVKQLHAQARAAAARSDCAAVKALAKKIAAKDAPYYRANIALDTALAACLN